jgi:hypothetical protein
MKKIKHTPIKKQRHKAKSELRKEVDEIIYEKISIDSSIPILIPETMCPVVGLGKKKKHAKNKRPAKKTEKSI